jgi:hypothetical protein
VCLDLTGYDEQGEPGDEIEYYPQHLIKHDERVEHRIERFEGDIKEFAVEGVYPIAGKDTNKRRANQYEPINNRAPQKE